MSGLEKALRVMEDPGEFLGRLPSPALGDQRLAHLEAGVHDVGVVGAEDTTAVDHQPGECCQRFARSACSGREDRLRADNGECVRIVGSEVLLRIPQELLQLAF